MAMAARTGMIDATTISSTRENPQAEARQTEIAAWRFFPSKLGRHLKNCYPVRRLSTTDIIRPPLFLA